MSGLVTAEDGRVADFPITDAEFLKFRDFFYRRSGVQFAVNKRYFVDRRIAERAKAKGINAVVFDTSGLKYHGRVAALAAAAREAGLEF